jgi:hypothetical protein
VVLPPLVPQEEEEEEEEEEEVEEEEEGNIDPVPLGRLGEDWVGGRVEHSDLGTQRAVHIALP